MPSNTLLSPDAIAKLRRAQAAILADPALYDQLEPRLPACGSPGCVCGWLVKLYAPDDWSPNAGDDLSHRASLILGVDGLATDRLFSATFGRSDVGCRLYDRYHAADEGSQTRAEVASDWIDYYIETDTHTEGLDESSR